MNRYIFEMPPAIYEIARFLGQNQQWFLFDKPQKYSFWFDIVGLVEIKCGDSSLFQKEKTIKHLNLHKILQMYVNDNYFLSLGYAKRSLQDLSSILYRPITGKIDACPTNFTGRNYSRTIVFGNYTNDWPIVKIDILISTNRLLYM